MMKNILDLVVILLSIFEILNVFFIYRILSGDGPPYAGSWAEVFKGILAYTIAILVLQFLAYGTLWLGRQANIEVFPFPSPLYTWGLRLLALLILWRVVWPRRRWSETQPVPPYARLQLLGLALLAGTLSFLPIA